MAKKPFKGCKREELKAGIEFPCMISFKVDGYRCMNYDGKGNTTSGSDFANLYTVAELKRLSGLLNNLDCEIIIGNPWDVDVFSKTTSAMKSIKSETPFDLWVFDDFSNIDLPFAARYLDYCARVEDIKNQLALNGERVNVHAVEYRWIKNQEEYDAMKEEAAMLGYEGLYGKSPKGKYKHGRSTPVEATCWKDKPWTTAEAVIVGYNEMMENQNEATLDNFGRTKRQTLAENLVGKGILGSYTVKSSEFEPEFNVSCGTMTMERRKAIWEAKNDMGEIITFKYFAFGVVDVPRSAAYVDHRPGWDME